VGTRSALVIIFGLAVVSCAAFLSIGYEDWAAAPYDRYRFEESFSLAMMISFLLSACCGWSCGLTIARLKRQQQWSALLPTPLRFRTLLVGVCLPRWIDGITLMLLLLSVFSVGLPLHGMTESNEFWVGPLVMAPVLIVCTATSLFGSAFTKSPAKTGFLGVVLAVMLGTGFGFLMAWVGERFPQHEGPRLWWENWTPTIVSLVALTAASALLTWLACRRLRWDR
jgi:hypothetical protein